jgi:hypothetical protein
MKKSLSLLLFASVLTSVALLAAGCGSSSRTTIEGYSDDMLSNRRVAVLFPAASEITFSNVDALAASRGVDPAGAPEAFHGELRTQLVDKLDVALDSNTVLDYGSLPVAGSIPLSAESDFAIGSAPNWEKLRRSGREGNLDYLVVVNRMTVSNTPSSSGGRGDESVKASYTLVDLSRSKVMTGGTVDFTVSDPRTPSHTWQRLVEKLTPKLPFVIAARR